MLDTLKGVFCMVFCGLCSYLDRLRYSHGRGCDMGVLSCWKCVCCGWQLLVTYGLMYVQSGYRWWVVWSFGGSM